MTKKIIDIEATIETAMPLDEIEDKFYYFLESLYKESLIEEGFSFTYREVSEEELDEAYEFVSKLIEETKKKKKPNLKLIRGNKEDEKEIN